MSEVNDLDGAALQAWPLPQPGGGKQSRGQVLVVGGSRQTPGSVFLAGEAALRAGAGKVQVATAGSVAGSLAVAMPEALVMGLPEDREGQITDEAADLVLDLASSADAVLLGPGLLKPDRAVALLEAVVPKLDAPSVLDAVGMAFLGAHRDGLAHLEHRTVLTPNEAELAETLGWDEHRVHQDIARAARELAETSGATVVAGGEETVVVEPGGASWCWGATVPGLGTAGSGDVKAGVIAGLLARGLPPTGAAVWGVYLHQRAGQALTRDQAPVGFLAREVLALIPSEMARSSHAQA